MVEQGQQLTVRRLLDTPAFGFTLRAGAVGLDRVVERPTARAPLPGLERSEHLPSIGRQMVIVGSSERRFLDGLEPEERAQLLVHLTRDGAACVVVTGGARSPDDLVAACDDSGVALLESPLQHSGFVREVSRFVQGELAKVSSLHGVLVDVIGVGILLTGPSGIGKSETGLDLVRRGHRLVADDYVTLTRKGDSVVGSCSPVIMHHMEVLGLGIINVKDLFGISAVRQVKRIDLVVELVAWESGVEYDRLGIDEKTQTLVGVEIPHLVIPVRPGRNTSTIIEVAARNQLLKAQGHHSARRFQDKLSRQIAMSAPTGLFSGEVE